MHLVFVVRIRAVNQHHRKFRLFRNQPHMLRLNGYINLLCSGAIEDLLLTLLDAGVLAIEWFTTIGAVAHSVFATFSPSLVST